jgi:hypothetical protein
MDPGVDHQTLEEALFSMGKIPATASINYQYYRRNIYLELYLKQAFNATATARARHPRVFLAQGLDKTPTGITLNRDKGPALPAKPFSAMQTSCRATPGP